MLREYNAKKDRDHVRRIWREVGWLGDKEKHAEEMNRFITCGRAFVAEVNGEAECLVNTAPGTIRHIADDLPLCAVTGVTTSRVARKQRLASRLAAKAVAQGALDGSLVAALGVFEQGFYNQLGFGSGGYEHTVSFDPALLRVKSRARIPIRLGPDDWEAAHAARLARTLHHGGVNITPAGLTRGEMTWSQNGFGLGYRDGPHGELTHYLWCEAKAVEQGPYKIECLVYRTPEQFLELMALLRGLGDQVRLVQLREPPGIQLQDLIKQPMKQRQVTRHSAFEVYTSGLAYWQARVQDLPGCMAHTKLRCGDVRFNLSLSDPISEFIDEEEAWRGAAGDYVVTLGTASQAEPGTDTSLPTLRASVGAFTRLWLGVRPASGLAVTDELSAPPELLEQLDWAFLLPDPKPDWDF